MKNTYQLQYVSASCQFAFHQSQLEVVKQRLSLHTEKHIRIPTSHLGFLNEEHLPTAVVRVCFLPIRLPPVTVGGGEAEAESTHTSHLGFLNEEHLPTAVRVCFLPIRLPSVTVGGGEAEAESTHRELNTYVQHHIRDS